jgi:hypothetical protein
LGQQDCKLLGEGIEARGVCQLPGLGDLLREGVHLHRRSLLVVRKERAQSGVAGEHQAEGVELRGPFQRQGLRLENGTRLGAKDTYRHAQGVGQRLEHGEAFNRLDTSLHLGNPALRAAESCPKFSL